MLSGRPERFAEVLVVASPCPLILAAPVAMVSGMSRASRNGIVVKTGSVLEKLAVAKTGAFDKTGTITSGQLTLIKSSLQKKSTQLSSSITPQALNNNHHIS